MTRGRKGLGRGLDALLSATREDPAGQDASEGVRRVAIGAIRPNPYQPRRHFAAEELAELADSIKAHGLIQPLVVAEEGTGYCLIAGERRLRASQQAGLTEVPVVVRSAEPREMLALAIIENVQRADLDPLETAAAYRQLIDEFGATQAEVARIVGKSRVAVANTLRLLGLPESVRALVAGGHLSEGHARALLAIERADFQALLAERAASEGWTVRRVEAEARAASGDAPAAPPLAPSGGPVLDPDTADAVRTLESALGTRVEIRRRGAGGQLVVWFYAEEELAALYDRLTGDG
jgi:ParB family chromosome partitioning protein